MMEIFSLQVQFYSFFDVQKIKKEQIYSHQDDDDTNDVSTKYVLNPESFFIQSFCDRYLSGDESKLH